MSAKSRTKLHEGLRLKLYECTAGKQTIGYGHNIEDLGITLEVAELLFENDWRNARGRAEQYLAYEMMDEVRRGVFIELCFWLGNRIEGFKKFLQAAQNQDWVAASEELLDSKAARQAPDRMKELARLMLRGVFAR